MFERRLRIFMVVIWTMSLMLLGRVFAVQVVGHAYWTAQLVGLLTKTQFTETTRGRILDFHGKPLALDVACTDVCVDYRAIIDPPDPKWVDTIVAARLKNRMGAEYVSAHGDKRKALILQETAAVRGDIKAMWLTLARLNPEIQDDPTVDPQAAMNQIRKDIVQMVQARRKYIAAQNQQRDQTREAASSRLMKWLAGPAPAADDLTTIVEQQESHVILPDLNSDACNALGKQTESLPGLVRRPSTHRVYPMKTVACHLLGRMSRVSPANLDQAKRDGLDEFRQYKPNDLVGQQGVEALCEPLLRGSRGKIEKRVGDENAIVAQQDFVPGSDVRLSIDSDLQAQAQQMLQHVVEKDSKTSELYTPVDGVSMHAAVVVLDVKTNEVRVLASNPGFDVNELQSHYSALVSDTSNEPLINRATSDTCEPGSTVKPLIGLSAITQGTIGVADTIDCTGYLYLPEIGPDKKTHLVRMPHNRCWILSENMPQVEAYWAQHGKGELPDWAMHHAVTYSDALERSCDIYFETVADRLGPELVNHWYDQFGFGRSTGIGIFERPGLRPELFKGRIAAPRVNNCYAGMGQGTVLATPLQIANEAATIARGGIWMRPRLLTAESQAALDAAHPRSDAVPDRVDLHLNPQALIEARRGMVNVVDGSLGTGKIEHKGFTLAAKTGTADTAWLWVNEKGPDGKPVRQKLTPVIRHGEEGLTPWYRSSDGSTVVHSWYMGFAPADNPQVAFCVLVEYAGAGGSVAAGPIASHILEACAHAGYLAANPDAVPTDQTASAR